MFFPPRCPRALSTRTGQAMVGSQMGLVFSHARGGEPPFASCSPWCAQRPRASRREERRGTLPRRGSRWSAQRPRASRREEHAGHAGGNRPCGQVLNARGHRGGKNWPEPFLRSPASSRAQRPRASRREELVALWITGSPCAGAQRPRASRRKNLRRARYLRARSDVLNARGHRGGKNALPTMRIFRRNMCSTPEGIEAGRTTQARANEPSFPCAQRPRASRREEPSTPSTSPGGQRCAQRPRASRREEPPRGAVPLAPFDLVLNARGHRGGKNVRTPHGQVTTHQCSTPEGIEAGRTMLAGRIDQVAETCSTPEGIEAGRTNSSQYRSSLMNVCSTPEGIEAGRTFGFEKVRDKLLVLNARGHRGGKNMLQIFAVPISFLCSTPEGIEAGRTRTRF